MSKYEAGVYAWTCGADVYPIPYPSDIPDECGATGEVEFEPDEDDDGGPSVLCTRCGSELSAECFERVRDLPEPTTVRAVSGTYFDIRGPLANDFYQWLVETHPHGSFKCTGAGPGMFYGIVVDRLVEEAHAWLEEHGAVGQ